jgi:hypothetical protein
MGINSLFYRSKKKLSTELTQQQNFEKKITDRLRKDIGDLIPDDMLGALVKQTIDKMFFTRTVIKSGHYEKKEDPSWFEKEVVSLLNDTIKGFVKEQLSLNAEQMKKIISEVISKETPMILAGILLNLIQGSINNSQWDIQNNILQTMRDNGINV